MSYLQVKLLSKPHTPSGINVKNRLSPSIRNSHLASTTSTPPFLVPNVVHYVWFKADRPFTFMHYLSFLSVQRYLAPDRVLLHGDALLRSGVWWERALSEVDNLYFVNRTRPYKAPNGVELGYIEHAADIARLGIVLGEWMEMMFEVFTFCFSNLVKTVGCELRSAIENIFTICTNYYRGYPIDGKRRSM